MAETHPNEIATFKNAFDGGTRPNRFVISGTIGQPVGDAVESLLVKAGQVPAQTLGVLQIPFRGRVAKLPGDRAYAEWTFTMVDTTGAESGRNFRREFESWHESFNKHRENVVEGQNVLNGTNEDFYTQWTVQQLDMTGTVIPDRTITLINCWPVEVGAIDLSYDAADTITEYTVTLAYDYLELKNSI